MWLETELWLKNPYGVYKRGSFTIVVMPRRFRRTCPICGRPNLKNISTHLYQIHGLSSEERKPYLKQARVSSWHPYTDLSEGEMPSEGEQETKKKKWPPHSVRKGRGII